MPSFSKSAQDPTLQTKGLHLSCKYLEQSPCSYPKNPQPGVGLRVSPFTFQFLLYPLSKISPVLKFMSLFLLAVICLSIYRCLPLFTDDLSPWLFPFPNAYLSSFLLSSTSTWRPRLPNPLTYDDLFFDLPQPPTLIAITSDSGILITCASSETSTSSIPHRDHHLLFFQLLYLLWYFHSGIFLALSFQSIYSTISSSQLHPHFPVYPVLGSRSIIGMSPFQAPIHPLVLPSCVSLTWLILKLSPTICLLQTSTDTAEETA